MFFSDPTTIQSHLNNDCALLLKNIKSLQDRHLDLLHHNHRIINTAPQQSQLDSIRQHKKLKDQITLVLQTIRSEQLQIHQKYENMCISEQGVIRLMGRVVGKVLQICQHSTDKCKQFDDSLVQKLNKMRRSVIELVNSKEGVKLDQVLKCITEYVQSKLLCEHQKLTKVIEALQNGQEDKLKEIYLQREKKQAKSIERKLDIIRDLSKAKAQKESIKMDNKIKKQKQRIINHLYSPMLLAKVQTQNEESQGTSRTQKLYSQIMQRNKFNSQQIIQFEQKSVSYQQKTKAFKEWLQDEEKKMKEICILKALKKEKQRIETQSLKDIIDNPHTKSLQTEVETNIENVHTQGNIDPQVKNQKKILNTHQFKIKSLSSKKETSDLPNIFTNFIITHENFSAYKFDPIHRDLFTRTNRQVLPDISGKGTSLDQSTQITKIKIDKILRTTVKKDLYQENNRKNENTRKSIFSNRQDSKNSQQSEKDVFRLKGLSLSESLARRVHIQRNKIEINDEDNPLHVKKAEIKYYQQKYTIL